MSGSGFNAPSSAADNVIVSERIMLLSSSKGLVLGNGFVFPERSVNESTERSGDSLIQEIIDWKGINPLFFCL